MENDRPATSNACFIQGGDQAVGKKPDKELNPTKSLRYGKFSKLTGNSSHETAQHKKTNFLESFIKKTKRNTATAKQPQPNTSQDSTSSSDLVKPEVVTPPKSDEPDAKLTIVNQTASIVSTTATIPLLSSQSLDQSISPFKKKQLLEIEKLEKSRRWSESSSSSTVNKISSKLKSTVIVDESGKRVHQSTNTTSASSGGHSSGSSFTEKDCIEE